MLLESTKIFVNKQTNKQTKNSLLNTLMNLSSLEVLRGVNSKELDLEMGV